MKIVYERLWRKETEYQLASNNCSEFVNITDATELITKLYLEKSLEGLEKNIGDEFNLHGIVEDIAKRYNLDIEAIRENLVSTWLVQTVRFSESDCAKYLPSFRLQMKTGSCFKNEHLIKVRVIYILESQSIEKSISFLLEIVYSQDSKISTLSRVRSLGILLEIAKPSEIDEFIDVSYSDLTYLMQVLLYLADFEELRIIQTLKDFETCDKESLVKSLWINNGDEEKVVELICNICMDFKIYDVILWEKCLLQLFKSGSVYSNNLVSLPVICFRIHLIKQIISNKIFT